MANPNIEAAYFWIQRNGSKYKGLGSNLSEKMVVDDLVWVQRGSDKFYAKYDGSNSWPTIRDTDWVWAQAKDSNNEWKHYKVSGKNFKELFGADSTNFEVKNGTVYFNMKMYNTSQLYEIERRENGRKYNIQGSYTNTSLPVGNYTIPMEGCEWFKCANSPGEFEFKPNFDTSNVSCMYFALGNCRNFNSAVNHFDMSNCTNTRDMFFSAQSFNQSVAEWDLSTVQNAYGMFYNCRNFNSPVTNLKFGATNCQGLFHNCRTFNQPLTGVDFSNATLVTDLFRNCLAFNQPISNLDFSNVSDGRLKGLWLNCQAFNQDFTQVTWPATPNFETTFHSCKNLNQPKLSESFPFPEDTVRLWFPLAYLNNPPNISNWTRPLPRICSGLFSGWSQFNQNVSHLDLSECNEFSYAFQKCPNFNPSDINDLDVSGVKNLRFNFDNCTRLKRSLDKWDVSECENFAYLFHNTSHRNFGISNWNVSNATNMNSMFQGSIVGDDLSSWDVSNVTDFRYMFDNWGTKESLLSNTDKLDIKIDSWSPASATNMYKMFDEAGKGTYIAPINVMGWRMPQMTLVPNTTWDGENQPWYKWNNSYRYDTFLSGVPGWGMPVIESGYEPTYTIHAGSLFNSYLTARHVKKYCTGTGQGVQYPTPHSTTNQTEVRISSFFGPLEYQVDLFEDPEQGNLQFRNRDYGSDASNENWSFVKPCGPFPELMNAPTNMHQLFYPRNQREKIQNISGLEYINTSNVTDMTSMYFNQTENRQGVNNDLSGWDVRNVKSMDSMFSRSTVPVLGDLSNWCVPLQKNKPRDFSYGTSITLITKDPQWGTCPGDPSYEPPIPGGMPDGAWTSEHQQYYISIEDSATSYDRYLIDLNTSSQRWRAPRGTMNFVKQSNSSNIELTTSYDWIVTSRSASDRISFAIYGGNIKFLGADTSNVTNMANMFKYSEFFNDDIWWWDTSKATNMRNMFYCAKSFNRDLSGWDVSNVSCFYQFDRYANSWRPAYKPRF